MIKGAGLVPLLAAASAMAAPSVSVTSFTQDPVTCRVHVGYTLSEPAVVTMEVLTNGVSVGAENLRVLAGDVNKLVASGSGSIGWTPDFARGDSFLDCEVAVRLTAWPTDATPPWMVVDLAGGGVFYYVDEDAVPGGVRDDRYKTDYLLMRRIPAAKVTWRMGSPTGETGQIFSYGGVTYDNSASELQHEVTFGDSYYMGTYPVTIRQYQRVTANRIGSAKNTVDADFRPVEMVSYDMIRGTEDQWPATDEVDDGSFCGILRGRTGISFDLPTDAQWEFACRAGVKTALYDGHNLTGVRTSAYLDGLAWYYHDQTDENRGTHPVGEKAANVWGLYDMLGNVREWCRDWYSNPSGEAVTDPKGAASGEYRVIRGGDWTERFAASVRAAARGKGSPNDKNNYNLGFRLVAPGGVVSAGENAEAPVRGFCDLLPYDGTERTDFWDTTQHPLIATVTDECMFEGEAFRTSRTVETGGDCEDLVPRCRTSDVSDEVPVRTTSPTGGAVIIR